jgi:tetratricopeptide (TPR) repeat protein
MPRRSEARRIDKAWKHLANGDAAAASRRARKAGDSPAARLLRTQITLVAATDDPLDELEALTRDLPKYAAAWLTLSVAAERGGAEALALEAARRGAELWPNELWTGHAQELSQRLVEQRFARAAEMLDGGDIERSLELIRIGLSLAPDHRQGKLLAAHALLADGQVEDAEMVLATLGGDPDALFLAGLIAEDRHDWQTAMDLFASLPADMPDRDAALERVQRRWRLVHLPPHIQRALSSPRLTRGQLAALMTGLAPQLDSIDGGSVPVLPDIVDDASQREILTAVRLQLIDVDPLERRFHPDREADPHEVRQAVDGLCHLLGVPAPVWCEPDMLSSSCTALPDPLTGESVAELLLALELGASP